MGCFGVFLSALLLIGTWSLFVTLLHWLIETMMPFGFSLFPKTVQDFFRIMFLVLLGGLALYIAFLFFRDWLNSRKENNISELNHLKEKKAEEDRASKLPEPPIIDLLYTSILQDEKTSLDKTYTLFLKSSSQTSVYKKNNDYIIIWTTSTSCGELRSRIKHQTPTEIWAMFDFTPSFTLMSLPWYIKTIRKTCTITLSLFDDAEVPWVIWPFCIVLLATCKAFLSIQFQKDYNYDKKRPLHRTFLKHLGFYPISIWYVGKASTCEWLPVEGRSNQSQVKRGKEVFLEGFYMEYSAAQVSGALLPNKSTDKVRTLLCKLITI
jgi:hypothetical protein